MIDWKQTFDTAASVLAVLFIAMGLVAVTGAAVFFWELVGAAR